MRAPLVSVVLPVYNRATLLPHSVRSVFAQTEGDWELLIADDGSTDGTRALLSEWSVDPRVRVLELEHSGNPAVVRNAALRAARGEFVAFLDSDDVWMPEKLQRQVSCLCARPACGWSYTAFHHVDVNGRFLDDGARARWTPVEGDIFGATITGSAPIRTASVAMARRELIESAGGFDEELVSGQDYDLWMRLALRTPVCVLDEALTAVRVHARSHSSAWPPRALEFRDLSLRKVGLLAGDEWQDAIQRQRRRNAAALASSYQQVGARRAMLHSMRRNLQLCWHDPRWWASIARTLARDLFARAPEPENRAITG
jgi:glycosyltransferase involved in cell wall biosynthesis